MDFLMKKSGTLFLILPFLLTACGKDFVTVTLLPGGASTPPANLMHQLSSMSLINGIVATAPCPQFQVMAGGLADSSSGGVTNANITPVSMNTSFAVDTTVTLLKEDSLATALNDSTLTSSAPIKVTVPRGTNLSVGMVGKILLGGPSSINLAGSCMYATPQTATNNYPWAYATVTGRANLTTQQDTTFPLPVDVSRAVSKLTYGTDGKIIPASTDLQTEAARDHYSMVWIASTGPGNLLSATALIDPSKGTNPAAKVELPLFTSSADPTPIPGAPQPDALPTGTSTVNSNLGYVVPRVFPIKFTVVFRDSSTNPATDSTFSVICDDPPTKMFPDPTVGREGISTYVVDFSSRNTPQCLAP